MNKTKIFGLLLVFLSLNLISCSGDDEPIDPELLVPIDPVVDSCAAPNAVTVSNFSGNSVSVSWTASEGGSWEVQYGLDGFIPGTGTSVTSTTTSATVNNLTTTNNYDFYVRTNCGGGLFSDWTGPVAVGTSVVNCTAPTNFTALRSATDATKANLTWTGTGQTDWTIEYGATGFAHGVGTTVVAQGTPSKVISGLLAANGYDFYIKSNCSATESSTWIGPVHINAAGSSGVTTYTFMNANVKGTQFNGMKPFGYPFTGTAAKLQTLDDGSGRILWIQGDTNPLSTSLTDNVEINIRIHENFWHAGTFPLVTNNFPFDTNVTVDLIDQRNDSPLIIETELPGTIEIQEFNPTTRRIKGTFSFTYMESGTTETGPYAVTNGTFDFEVPEGAF